MKRVTILFGGGSWVVTPASGKRAESLRPAEYSPKPQLGSPPGAESEPTSVLFS